MTTIDFVTKQNEGGLSFPTSVSICLRDYSRDENQNALLSPELMTIQEIDFHIDRLIGELEKVRKLAKQKLKKSG